MLNHYIYNREGYLHCLLEIFEYCSANNLVCNKTDQEGDDYVFTIKISKDAVLDIYTVVEKVHDLDIVRIHFIPNTVHSKYVKNKFKIIKVVGGLGYGGLQAFAAFLLPGVGIGIGLLATGLGYLVGAAPGFALNKTDELISKKILKACEIHISKLIHIFNSYLLNFDKITQDLNPTDKEKWMNRYIEKNNYKLYSFKVKQKSGHNKVEKVIECNSFTYNKKGVVVYNTFDKRDSGQEIKGKYVDGSLKVNNEVKNKAFYVYVESEILPNYDKEISENTTDSEKIKELEIALANKCKY